MLMEHHERTDQDAVADEAAAAVVTEGHHVVNDARLIANPVIQERP